MEMSDLTGNLGCFAKKDFHQGDRIFTIPRSCMLGIYDSLYTPYMQFLRKAAAQISKGTSSSLTSAFSAELLIWLHMIEQKGSGRFSPFLRSLDDESPSLLSWDPKTLDCIRHTTLGNAITHSAERLTVQMTFLKEIIKLYPEESRTFGLDLVRYGDLSWAKGHYLARRYPSDFTGPLLSTDECLYTGKYTCQTHIHYTRLYTTIYYCNTLLYTSGRRVYHRSGLY